MAGDACESPAAFEAMTVVAMDACCPTASAGGHRRSLQATSACDLPDACPSLKCAAAFVTYMADCDATLSGLPGLPYDQFRALNTSCYDLQETGGELASMQPLQVLMFRVRVNTLDADAQAAAMFSGTIGSAPLDPLQHHDPRVRAAGDDRRD